MKRVWSAAIIAGLLCAVTVATADDSPQGPIGAQAQVAGGVSQGPAGTVSPAVSASGMIQYDLYKAKVVHDKPLALQLEPKLEGSITVDPAKPGVDSYSLNLDLFKFYTITHSDPKSPIYGWQEGLSPHIGVSRDNQLKLTQGPSIELERSGVIYSERSDDGSIERYCSLLAPAMFFAPDEVGLVWSGPNTKKGAKVQWNIDARCRLNLGHGIGQLDLQAGGAFGFILAENPDANDGSLYFTSYARADLKRIAGSDFYVGTEATDTGLVSHDGSTSSVKTLTGHVGIVY